MTEVSNKSGHGEMTEYPEGIAKWNWGAFFLSVFWGMGNKSYIALLTLLPIGCFVMPFVLGANGNQMAWKYKRWDSVEHFLRIQKRWSIAGWLMLVVLLMPVTVTSLTSTFSDQRDYRIIKEVISSNVKLQEALGKDLTPTLSSVENPEGKDLHKRFHIEYNGNYLLVLATYSTKSKLKECTFYNYGKVDADANVDVFFDLLTGKLRMPLMTMTF